MATLRNKFWGDAFPYQTRWRKNLHLRRVCENIYWQSEEACAHSFWRQAAQMCRLRKSICSSSPTVERGGTIVTNARACTLKRYMLLTHVQSSNKPYKCSQCSYASSVARHLQGHIRTHSLQKTKKCRKCDYSTIYLSHLKKHLFGYA